MIADGGEIGTLVDTPVLPVPGVDDAPRVSEQHDYLAMAVALGLILGSRGKTTVHIGCMGHGFVQIKLTI